MEVSVSLKKAIENYINGDQSAFTTIYNESNRYIYVCINNVMSGNDNKEDMICDIMQDTYLEICKHINSLQNVNQFLSWAGTIATRKCYEHIKKSGKYALLNEDESFDSLADDDNIIPEEIMQNKEKQRLLREIIQNELTEMQKLCVVGYFYNEMKQSEIAKELGIPENSVKSHLLRAKAKIKESVLDLEKNKGTKLYSVAPLLLLLFLDEIKDCVVSPAIGQAVSASVGVGVEVVSAGAGATGTAASMGASTTAGATASTVGTNVATAATSAVKVKAIVIAAASAVAVGGIGVGVGIAVHNAKKDAPVGVVETTEDDKYEEETTTKAPESTEEETTEIIEVSWNDYEFAEFGQMYLTMFYGPRYVEGEIVEPPETVVEDAKIGINNMNIIDGRLEVNLNEIEFLDKIPVEYVYNRFTCELIDKKTGEVYETVYIYEWDKAVYFNKTTDLENYYFYFSYYSSFCYGENYKDGDYYTGLLYEINLTAPDDGLKSTLVEAARKIYESETPTFTYAFADFDCDGVAEFLSLECSAFGGLYGEMYKYENGEYVYYMDVGGFADSCSKLYMNKETGDCMVIELKDFFYFEYDETGKETFYNSCSVYLANISTGKIENIDSYFATESRSIFYMEDGTIVTEDEFFRFIQLEYIPKYEYVGDLAWGRDYYDENESEYEAAYNYYLSNRIGIN